MLKNNKRKLLIILILIIFSIFTIYSLFRSNKINYIALGDSVAEGRNPYGEIGYGYTDFLKDYLSKKKTLNSYTKKYTKSGYVSQDIINLINTNSNLKKDLRESDLVTISIGANDFLHSINLKEISITNIKELKSKITMVLPNIENCIKTVRKYAKEDLIIVGYYNPIPFLFNTNIDDLDELFAYIDDEYNKIAQECDAVYISLYQLFKNNSRFLPNPTDIHPNVEGYKAIAEEIIKFYNDLDN